MLSAFIAPFKCMNPATVNTEDEDNLSKFFKFSSVVS